MAAGIGVAELVVLFLVAIIYVIPIAVAVWMIISIKRMRSDHEIFRNKIEAIERLLQNKN